MTMRIGFIGLGMMGSRMAPHLLDLADTLLVYNRTASKTEPLVAQGATAMESASGLAKQCDLVITMLSTPEVVEEVAFGDDGFVKAMPDCSMWMDCSTVTPKASQSYFERAQKQDIRFVDAPAAGTIYPAEDGTLTFLVGARDEDYDIAEPVLQAMGKNLIRAGEPGSGSALKMIVNLLLGHAMEAFSEGFVLGQHLGFDREQLVCLLSDLPVTAPFLKAKADKIENETTDQPEFKLEWMTKDLRLVNEAAEEINLSLPINQAMHKVYDQANQDGHGKEDFSAIYNWLKNSSD
jgi:3-hydroxyisobutyrate dehydrogenase-like beta-hydroxyacid dehydrogenase